MLQVRKIQINFDFINRQVTKVETTENEIESGLDIKGTVVFFPDDTEYRWDTKFEQEVSVLLVEHMEL